MALLNIVVSNDFFIVDSGYFLNYYTDYVNNDIANDGYSIAGLTILGL